MGEVKVKFFATLRDKIGVEVVEVNANTFKDLVVRLVEMYPQLKGEIVDEDFSLRDDYIYLVNGRNIMFLGNEDTALKDGDAVAMFPPVGGG
ncbi:MAG: MoaD/ThiS family protein [Synergistetes bacterium]|nr:MoaD/ThiS family protein [Synergistota bacterium]